MLPTALTRNILGRLFAVPRATINRTLTREVQIPRIERPIGTRAMRTLVLFGILLATAALAGCGNSATAVLPKNAVERGIFISSGDCAGARKLTIDQCGQVIDRAVALHQSSGPTYKSLNACAAAEGPDRCAAGVDGKYQPNLQAFLVTFGDAPNAVPLYATSDGSVGFKGLDKQKFGLNDDGYTVSDAAQATAHENARLAVKG